MHWFPQLEFGWMNGWIPLFLLALTDGMMFWLFPREVVNRLFDRSGWRRSQIVYTVIGKLIALACLGLLIFTPIKAGSLVGILGIVIVMLGLAGLVWALLDYRYTPMGQPVERGIYRLSRHPQNMMSSLVILGACVMTGSWAALVLLLLTRLFSHAGLVAEEEACVKLYGEAYLHYMQRTPRYFILF